MIETFDIRQHIQFNADGRAKCPQCLIVKGNGYNKLNLSVLENGAYKCFRGCTPTEIRTALGADPPKPQPDATIPEKKPKLLTPQQVQASHLNLTASRQGVEAVKWLAARGITDEMIAHYRIGLAKAKVGTINVEAIALHIPANDDGTQFYQKKRVAPWLTEQERQQQLGSNAQHYKAWSQFGIPPTVWFTHKPDGAKSTWLCEGEWDAILLGWQAKQQNIPIAVATFTCGAGTLPPESELKRLPGTIYIFYDRDPAGENGAKKLRSALGDRGRPALVPGPDQCPKGWDISDCLNGGYTLADLQQATETADFTRERDKNELDITAIATTRKGRLLSLLRESYSDRLRFNAMSKQVELDGQPLDPDFVYLSLLEQGLDVGSKEFAVDVFLYLAKKNAYNPVAQYLERVATEHPPDPELLNTAASRYLRTNDPLHASFLRKTLIAAVARALRPGCKVDTALIFTGGQGLGKSTFWSILAGDFFCDSLSGQTSDTDEKIKLYSAWIHEWAELEQVFKRKETSQVKSFLSATHDTFRMPWGRSAEKFPRHSVVVGTTNEDDFLSDATGSRRYWVIQLKQRVCLELLERDRDRLWAAAVWAFREGASWILSPEEAQQSEQINQRFQREDPWFGAIEHYAANRETIRVSELLDEAIKLELPKQDRASQMRVADCLKSLGWQRRHTDKGKIWVKPDEIGSQVVSQQPEPNNEAGYKTDYLFSEGSQRKSGSQEDQTMTPPPDYLNPLTTSKTEVVSAETPDISSVDGVTDYLTTKNAPNLSPFLKLGEPVEILVGRFRGIRAVVTGFEGDRVLVRASRWAIDRDYMLCDLKRLG